MNYFNINGFPSQKGKVVIITGANVGLGYETALALAKKEMTVILACRNIERGEAAQKKIQEQAPHSVLKMIPLDLSRRSSVERFVSTFQEKYNRLDILINNAGIMVPPFKLTEDGWESQMAVNYLGHFLLTSLLINILNITPKARVVSLSSIAHRRGMINFDDLNSKNHYSKFKAYAQSKLACLLFAKELDRRLKERGSAILSLAAHPGVSLTNLGRYIPKPIWWFFYPLTYFITQSARAGSKPILLAALGYPGDSKEIKGGEYFGPTGYKEWKGRAGRGTVAPQGQDLEVAKKLWEISEKILEISFFHPHSK